MVLGGGRGAFVAFCRIGSMSFVLELSECYARAFFLGLGTKNVALGCIISTVVMALFCVVGCTSFGETHLNVIWIS